MKKRINLSIIIVAYKKVELVRNCLESIYRYNDIGDELEVIIVDNSPDESYVYDEIITEYPSVIFIKNENKGFGEGNNRGAEIAKGKFLLFLNPDTILIESLFKFAIDRFNQDLELACFGVKLLDENLNSNFSYFYRDKNSFFNNQVIKLVNKLNLFNSKSMFISGANIFIRKDVFNSVGMFDENIFLYMEEPDLMNRIDLLGNKFKIRFYKEKRIIHLEGGSQIMSQDTLKFRMESTEYYCQKYGLDFKKRLIREYNYERFKLFWYKIFKKEIYLQKKINLDVYSYYIYK